MSRKKKGTKAQQLKRLIAAQRSDMIDTHGKLEYMKRRPDDAHRFGTNGEVIARMKQRGLI